MTLYSAVRKEGLESLLLLPSDLILTVERNLLSEEVGRTGDPRFLVKRRLEGKAGEAVEREEELKFALLVLESQ